MILRDLPRETNSIEALKTKGLRLVWIALDATLLNSIEALKTKRLRRHVQGLTMHQEMHSIEALKTKGLRLQDLEEVKCVAKFN